jgi:homoserine kinase
MNLKFTYSKVFAPATIANVGPGFDILGLALNQPGDEVEVRVVENPGVRINQITGDHGLLPLAADKNTATAGMLKLLQDINITSGIEVAIHKKMPVGSGMGSSAASSVAGICAVNALLDAPLTNEQLLDYALAGEKISSGGAIHLDNIAACLYGGLILVRSKNPADIIRLPVPDNLVCVVIHPRIEIKTSESRKLLRRDIPLDKAIEQWGNIAGLISGFFKNDMTLISRSLHDVIAEPVRSILIPEFDALKSEALKAGALGFSISGSGPSVFALCTNENAAAELSERLAFILALKNIEFDVYISKINPTGPRILDKA